MTSSLSLNVNFFNPFIGRWEPIIEPLTLYIETFQGEPPSSQRTVSIESDHGQAINPVYINISQEMVPFPLKILSLTPPSLVDYDREERSEAVHGRI